MTDGNLKDGTLVSREFWPCCENCALFAECKEGTPKHPAFPHTWHWGHKNVAFGEKMLVFDSWVGTIVIGDDHTGCKSYRADESCRIPLSAEHDEYIKLAKEQGLIDTKLNEYERRMILNERVKDLYKRWNEIEDRIQELVQF